MNKSQSGNVLFLILIAVALFAALSYAITKSSRGSGDAKKESAQASAARIIQEAGQIQATVMRLKLQGYTQVLFNSSAPNNSGTCYRGKTAVTPCKTIGLFSQEAGGFRPKVGNVDIPVMGKAETDWGLWSESLKVAGVEAGTTEPDMLLYIAPIEVEVCKEINKKENGTATILPWGTTTTTGFGWGGYYWSSGSITLDVGGAANFGEDYPARSGCVGDASWATYFLVFDDK